MNVKKRKEMIQDEVVSVISKHNYSVISPFVFVSEDLKKFEYQKYLTCNCCELAHRFRGLPTGNMNAKYMFIGEAPSVNRVGLDIEANYVWQDGPSSKMLKDALSMIKILDKSCFTNVLKCSLIKNKSQDVKKYHDCIKKFLIDEINIINPKIIVAVGKQAYDALKIVRMMFMNKKYRKINHPSYFRYKGNNSKNYARYIREELGI